MLSTGSRFAIATPHRAATATALKVFEGGGNAIDAALTAAAVLTVVYPHQCSIGGDLFALVRTPGGDLLSINGSGAAPQAVGAATLSASCSAMPLYGPHTITVPGVVAGWESIAALGASRDWKELLKPAVHRARKGTPVARSLARAVRVDMARLTSDPGLASTFYAMNGAPLNIDDIVVQPQLARSLIQIAEEGASAFYGGSVGTAFVHGLAEMGSQLTIEDLSAHKTEVTEPLRTDYGNWEVLTAAPNSQGFVLLEILMAISELQIDPDPLGPDAGALASIYRLASHDRNLFLADPRRATVPIDRLLDPRHVHGLLERVSDSWKATAAPLPAPRPSGDTVALVAADSDGWAVSLIQSIFHSFGSGVLEPNTGVICQNRGSGFSLDPQHPNVIEGGKRPAHTLMPVMILDNDRPVVVAGTMGGRAQPQIHAQVLPRVVNGDGLDSAVAMPRWIVGGLDQGTTTESIFIEGRAYESFDRLRKLNTPIHRLADWDEDAGHYAVIRLLPDDRFEAMSDPRSDGSAATGPS